MIIRLLGYMVLLIRCSTNKYLYFLSSCYFHRRNECTYRIVFYLFKRKHRPLAINRCEKE